MRIQKLATPFEEKGSYSWKNHHPRPQMKRDLYFSLCGEWDLFVSCGNKEDSLGKIKVPFAPESMLSGIERETGENEKYIYKKEFIIPTEFFGGRILLHFGAVDQIAKVYVNGVFVCEHIGGYTPFDADITDFVTADENSLRVEVWDNIDTDIPYGKQRRDRGGMWYTPVSGIWQPVWLEGVPNNYIQKIKITPTLTRVTIETEGGNEEKTVTLGEREYRYNGDKITIEIDSPQLWTPENPHLYEFTVTDGEDKIESYFALRTVNVEKVMGKTYICLNGKPYFFHGILDQGYYSDGIYTPATPEGYVFDILSMKKLGFNMLRKHIKIEPDIFYYYCDKLGMVVFQDMVNSGKYRYFADTVLPTVRIKHGRVPRPTPRQRAIFEKTLQETVKILYNHPSVCYYTIFNEGWGQYDSDRLYSFTKSLDSTRVVDSTSGWYKKQKSDVESEHVYFRKADLKGSKDNALVLSEFGGYSYKIDEHSFNLDKTYGYKKFTDKDEFTKALVKLYREEVIPCIEKGLCASVLTQLSDVEDETNGLVTYDRFVVKVEENVMRDLARDINNAFEKLCVQNVEFVI